MCFGKKERPVAAVPLASLGPPHPTTGLPYVQPQGAYNAPRPVGPIPIGPNLSTVRSPYSNGHPAYPQPVQAPAPAIYPFQPTYLGAPQQSHWLQPPALSSGSIISSGASQYPPLVPAPVANGAQSVRQRTSSRSIQRARAAESGGTAAQTVETLTQRPPLAPILPRFTRDSSESKANKTRMPSPPNETNRSGARSFQSRRSQVSAEPSASSKSDGAPSPSSRNSGSVSRVASDGPTPRTRATQRKSTPRQSSAPSASRSSLQKSSSPNGDQTNPSKAKTPGGGRDSDASLDSLDKALIDAAIRSKIQKKMTRLQTSSTASPLSLSDSDDSELETTMRLIALRKAMRSRDAGQDRSDGPSRQSQSDLSTRPTGGLSGRSKPFVAKVPTLASASSTPVPPAPASSGFIPGAFRETAKASSKVPNKTSSTGPSESFLEYVTRLRSEQEGGRRTEAERKAEQATDKRASYASTVAQRAKLRAEQDAESKRKEEERPGTGALKAPGSLGAASTPSDGVKRNGEGDSAGKSKSFVPRVPPLGSNPQPSISATLSSPWSDDGLFAPGDSTAKRKGPVFRVPVLSPEKRNLGSRTDQFQASNAKPPLLCNFYLRNEDAPAAKTVTQLREMRRNLVQQKRQYGPDFAQFLNSDRRLRKWVITLLPLEDTWSPEEWQLVLRIKRQSYLLMRETRP
ncbi:MAG: hypothetical protein M1814_004387 [Vezdaea aestivalis]|nr:MAG: hypothetical protein M1814_004387 [Vezdaea aestivalis]